MTITIEYKKYIINSTPNKLGEPNIGKYGVYGVIKFVNEGDLIDQNVHIPKEESIADTENMADEIFVRYAKNLIDEFN